MLLIFYFSQIMDQKTFGEITKKIDTSEANTVYGIKYEHGDHPMDGRSKPIKDSKEILVSKLLNQVELLRSHAKEMTSRNVWNISEDMDTMWDVFSKQNLESLEEVYGKIKKDEELIQIFYSYLPYIGSNDTIKMIVKLLGDEDVETVQKIRMLAIYPIHIDDHTYELFEMIIDEARKLVTDNLVWNSLIMSAGQLIERMYKNQGISKAVYNDYLEDFIMKMKGNLIGKNSSACIKLL